MSFNVENKIKIYSDNVHNQANVTNDSQHYNISFFFIFVFCQFVWKNEKININILMHRAFFKLLSLVVWCGLNRTAKFICDNRAFRPSLSHHHQNCLHILWMCAARWHAADNRNDAEKTYAFVLKCGMWIAYKCSHTQNLIAHTNPMSVCDRNFVIALDHGSLDI